MRGRCHMNSFYQLVKKEIREMLTPQVIVQIVVISLLFLFLGNFISGIASSANEDRNKVAIADFDKTTLSGNVLSTLSTMGFEVEKMAGDNTAAALESAKAKGYNSLVVIPKGFEAGITNKQPVNLEVQTILKTLSISAMYNSSSGTSAAAAINEIVSNTILSGNLTGISPTFAKNPVGFSETTIVGDKSAVISAATLMGFVTSKSVFIPLIVYMLVIFASQMISAAIANEKIDKTLETLLTTPVSRFSVVASKMCASGLVSLVNAVVFLVGFSGYMNGVTGGALEGANGSALSEAVKSLGFELTAPQYVLIGVQLFLTLLITLAVSRILGAMAKDIKGAQMAVMPIMLLVMLPYLLTMFADLGTMPLPIQILLYALPFTHTFMASNLLMMGNYAMYFAGLAYQVVLLVVAISFAANFFSSDKLFTVAFGDRKKKSLFGKKKSAAV